VSGGGLSALTLTTEPPMSAPDKPQARPARPYFSSGPCVKRPGWDAAAVAARAFSSRSHRAARPKAQLGELIDRTRALLAIPADYLIGIVPASDTGAFEMAMWSMLGARPVDMLVWESFGAGWAADAVKELKLADCRVLKAGYGDMPDLGAVRTEADVCFTWNGTTSGVRVPDGDWIAPDRQGLTLCDATSAAFAQALPWEKLDVTTFSWQKAMGGEAAHGMLVISPRAVERLENFAPPRPLPKIFRLAKGGKLIAGIFAGETINTPSMWCVADALDALDWIGGLGGLAASIGRADANAAALQAWVQASGWIGNLVADPRLRSNTSVCLSVTDPAFKALPDERQREVIKALVKLVEAEGAGYDFAAYKDAPPGLRIWCGTTVDAADIHLLTPWLDWAWAQVRTSF
jgi:phosphoserine aminotransferase